ncbi:hypothetical protein HNY73_010896 [Argiope bruennichi]|uniref:Transposase n=1 Tax=Argiope bruennichi TaxID=94029 RepID=A0A8T0F8M1_ARGBR|nr:hypothetical protein HNY73_010896 [Argiope bruennichi]
MEGIPYLIEFALKISNTIDMCQMDAWTRYGELVIQSIYSSPGPESYLGKPSDCPISIKFTPSSSSMVYYTLEMTPHEDVVEKFQNVLQKNGLGFRVSKMSDNKARPIFGNPGVATRYELEMMFRMVIALFVRNSIIRGESRKMCGKQVSLRYGSWFNSSRLTIEEIFLLTFEIVIGTRTGEIKEQHFFGKSTLSDWRQLINERILEYVEENSEKIGGVGKIVEVDESKFGKRKYNRDHVTSRTIFLGSPIIGEIPAPSIIHQIKLADESDRSGASKKSAISSKLEGVEEGQTPRPIMFPFPI